ncbi:MAG: 30S ribosomal protein S16 [Bacteroidia bacterium]|nr:30S ribosomal protein S16 [Bacteroidia bacterium]
MPAKLRLQRFGKKGYPYYHIVVADSRAPRDGKFIERIGSYNPNTNPATIDLDTDKAVSWLQKGAQPTDTTRAILSYKGVLYKKHLAEGVKKGALTQEQADAKFETWSSTKSGKIDSKKSSLADKHKKDIEQRMQAERKVKEERAKAIEAKNTPPAETAAENTEAPAADETPAENA